MSKLSDLPPPPASLLLRSLKKESLKQGRNQGLAHFLVLLLLD
ncbi:hypothetical protein [Myxacorys almedinensis]|nr:hypothetical protein [Myxacorys almedinensis]